MSANQIKSERDATCARAWEVEAARDGRLSGDALRDVAQHIAQCDECRAHSGYLDGLANALGAVPETATDALAVRRLRHRVLAQVDADLSGRNRKLTPSRIYLACAVVSAVLVVGGWSYMYPTSNSQLRLGTVSPRMAAQIASKNTTIDTVDEGGARWSRHTEGEIERIDLSEGTLRLHVKKTPAGKRVVVHVPDGEIDDIGTIFHVVVMRGRTQRVGVDEGRVTLRLTHAAPITLASGQSWERTDDTTLPVSALRMSSEQMPPFTGSIHPSRVSPQVIPEGSFRATTPPPHAADEDATYLRALRLLREGQDLEAQAVARDYLRKFPDGFRREEMGRIAR